MLVIGVDTGRHGAFVALNGQGRIVHKAVFTEGKNGIDFHAYIAGLRSIATPDTIAYVEEVHAIFNSSAGSTFKFGRNFQLALDGLMAAGITLKLITPKAWQKELFAGLTPIYKPKTDKLHTKAMAAKVALKHHELKHLLNTTRSKKPHEGLVDAALIARYGLIKEREIQGG
jgi:hypothetical protein